MSKGNLLIALVIVCLALTLPRILKLFKQPTQNGAQGKLRLYNAYTGLLKNLQPFTDLQELHKNDTTFSVAIGYNSNVDLIIGATQVMTNIFQEHPVVQTTLTARDHPEIHTFQELYECFLEYFRSGSAVERFIANEQVFQSILKHGKGQDTALYHIGGNAALMALFLQREGWKVLLSGAFGPKLTALMEQHQDKSNPEIMFANGVAPGGDGDEVHVIMEYPKQSQWLSYSTVRANRFIATRDIANAQFLSLKPFHELLEQQPIDLLILSGFHLLDGQEDSAISNTLAKVTTYLQASASKAHHSHVELASIGNRGLYREIAERVFQHIRSVGLNEQELVSLYHALYPDAAQLSNISQTIPNLHQVHIAMTSIAERYPLLSRIHFHSLAYHVILVKQSSTDWGSTSKEREISARVAVAASSLTATQRACGWNQYTDIGRNINSVELVFDVAIGQRMLKKIVPPVHAELEHGAVLKWKTGDMEVYLVPVLVCKQTIKTVGLGDAISASGISAQVKYLKLKNK